MVAWIFVAAVLTLFLVQPLSTWSPLSHDFGGWPQLVLGLVFISGLILFGAGAVLWTVVFPMVRPRMIVSRWGIRTVGSKPGGRFMLFAAAWPDVIKVDGYYTSTRWPFPPMLHLRITARGESVQRKGLIRMRRRRATVVNQVNGLLQGRVRDVLAILVQAHAEFGE